MSEATTMEITPKIDLTDFDFALEDTQQVKARVSYQGKHFEDGQNEVPTDITGYEVLQNAMLFGDLPSGEDYSVYIRDPKAKDEYVFFPSDARLDDTCSKAGISLDDMPEIEFSIAPEYKGA